VSNAPLIVPGWLDDTGLDLRTFRVYCRIARRAGERGECFESVYSMARDLGMKPHTVRAALRHLVTIGAIEVRGPGSRGTMRYAMAPPGWATTTVPVDRSPNRPRSRKARDYGPGGPLTTVPGDRRRSPTKEPMKESPIPAPVVAGIVALSSPTIAKVRKRGNGAGGEPSWTRVACDDWTERFNGPAPGGRIGKALAPLVRAHKWETVRLAWRTYLEHAKAEYASAERFAATYGRWSGASPDPVPTSGDMESESFAEVAAFLREGR
jgi:hypothetical protein